MLLPEHTANTSIDFNIITAFHGVAPNRGALFFDFQNLFLISYVAVQIFCFYFHTVRCGKKRYIPHRTVPAPSHMIFCFVLFCFEDSRPTVRFGADFLFC